MQKINSTVVTIALLVAVTISISVFIVHSTGDWSPTPADDSTTITPTEQDVASDSDTPPITSVVQIPAPPLAESVAEKQEVASESVEVTVHGAEYRGGHDVTYDVFNNTGETIFISNYAPLNTPTVLRWEENEWRNYNLVVPPPPMPMPGEDARNVVQDWPIDPGRKRSFYRPLQMVGGRYPSMEGGEYRLVVQYRTAGPELLETVSATFTVHAD